MKTTIQKVMTEVMSFLSGNPDGEPRRHHIDIDNLTPIGDPKPVKVGMGICLGFTQLYDCDEEKNIIEFFDKDNNKINVDFEIDHAMGKIYFKNEYDNIARIGGTIYNTFINCSAIPLIWNKAVSEYNTVVNNTQLIQIDSPNGDTHALKLNKEEEPFKNFFKIDAVYQNEDDAQSFPLLRRNPYIFIKEKNKVRASPYFRSHSYFRGVQYPFYIQASVDLPKIASTYNSEKDIEFFMLENSLNRLTLLLKFYAMDYKISSIAKSGAKDSFYTQRGLEQKAFALTNQLNTDMSFGKKYIITSYSPDSAHRPNKQYLNNFET